MAVALHAVVSELVKDLGELSGDVDRVEQRAYDPHLVVSIRSAEQHAAQAVSRAAFDVSIDPRWAETAIAEARAAIGRAKGLAADLLAELERSRRIERRAVELCDEALRLTHRNRSIRMKQQH